MNAFATIVLYRNSYHPVVVKSFWTGTERTRPCRALMSTTSWERAVVSKANSHQNNLDWMKSTTGKRKNMYFFFILGGWTVPLSAKVVWPNEWRRCLKQATLVRALTLTSLCPVKVSLSRTLNLKQLHGRCPTDPSCRGEGWRGFLCRNQNIKLL